MTVLAIETSCDETSAAVVRGDCILSNIISSQIALHSEYGGVVPELAAREHFKNLPHIARLALAEAKVTPSELDAIAATRGPGLPGALLVGLRTAQAMAFALKKPFIGINHHEAHLYSPWISEEKKRAEFELFKPNISLIASGGHTLLVYVRDLFEHTVLGATVDDAAGECFDKVAKLIGLPYPGGPQLDKLADSGNPEVYKFPRPMINEDNFDFSFSGLKTSVRYFLRDNPDILKDRQKICNLCAGVRAAIVDVLVTKTLRAVEKIGVNCITASGGVTCNRLLRSELKKSAEARNLTLRLAERVYCTDNAGMIGVVAAKKLAIGETPTSLDDDILPTWRLT